jgi:hypothetical protein
MRTRQRPPRRALGCSVKRPNRQLVRKKAPSAPRKARYTAKVHDFQEQLALGRRGEELFLEHYREPLALATVYSHDFVRLTDGAKLELKLDDYNPDKYPNFFLERWGNLEEKKPGGPWRARRDRIDVFIYYFVRANIYYEFTDLDRLLKHVERNESSYRVINVKNKGWITQGYLVPREELSEYYEKYTLEIK